MAKGIGHLPYKARHKQLTLEGSTPPLGPVAVLDWGYIGVIRQHIRHIVAARDFLNVTSPSFTKAWSHKSLTSR